MKLGELSEAALREALHQGLVLATGPFRFRITSHTDEVLRGLHRLYADFELPSDGFCDYTVRVDRVSGLRRHWRPQVTFHFDAMQPFKPLPADHAYALLEWGLNWCIAGHAHHYLLLHAAVLERNGRAIAEKPIEVKDMKIDVPMIFAILPVLPLLMLIVFSKYLQLFHPAIELDTTTAMIVSLFIAICFEFVRTRSFKAAYNSVKAFWNGMGKVFSDVVSLIVCAEIFSKGLIRLGLIDALVDGASHLGFSGVAIGICITILIFLAAMLMGSGNASFFSFGPLIPSISHKLGIAPVDMVLPMQLSASMGRATSPIAGVIIAIAEVAGVSPFELAKRNMIPLGGALLFMLCYNYLII